MEDDVSHTPFSIGQIVDNDELMSAYRVGNMGGMRRSKTFNCLVLISDHTKGLYEDKWHGDVLHYTGMGKIGDQVLRGNQNKTLSESRTNGVEVHLFEVLNAGEYTYRGVVELAGEPYQEYQPDDNGATRKVWMFPIRPRGGAPVVDEDDLKTSQEAKRARAEGMSLAALKEAAEANSTTKPGTRKVSGTEIVRDPYVAEYAKRMAAGVCQLCQRPAPFKDAKGRPYLETHYIVWLSRGGADSIDNVVALCPNCHRKMHVVEDPADVVMLRASLRASARRSAR